MQGERRPVETLALTLFESLSKTEVIFNARYAYAYTWINYRDYSCSHFTNLP